MKRVTMTDIAREAGVSKNAVSLALRNDSQVSEKTRKRIHLLATKMGYQRNPIVAHLMSELRSSGSNPARCGLALLNANRNPRAFVEHPTIPTYVSGCKRRAFQLGYTTDKFWLHEPDLTGDRLNDILKARGIRGGVVIGLMDENRLPAAFSETWVNYPFVVTGVRTTNPALSFASTDHHILALRAFEKAIALGYKRPGLVLERKIDRLVEGRFTAGYRTGQMETPATRRLRPFYETVEATKDLSVFSAWLEKEKPDVLFTLYRSTRDWVKSLGYRVPEDIGLIQLEYRQDKPDWSGMDQHNDICGEVVIDMLVAMIHNGESGVPKFPRATLIGPTWVDGKTT